MTTFHNLGNRQENFTNQAIFSDILLKKENKHGKHKNPNYYQDYYQKNRKKLLTYSHDYYGIKKSLESLLKREEIKITNSQEKFVKSLLKEIKENGVKKNPFAHEQACIYSNSLNLIKRNCCFFCSWVKATDKESIRLATKDKKPQYWTGSNWPNIKEKRRYQELLRQYGEWGTRTGKKVGQKYYVRVDLDLLWLPITLRENLEQGFLMMMRSHGIIFIKTKKGYHVILLLDELPTNGKIYHVDKFGVKRKIGDILSTGRQAQDLGSPEKEQPTSKGKWFWQDKNIEAVSKIFAKYFFSLECKEKPTQKSVSSSKIIPKKNFNGIDAVKSTKRVINQDQKAYVRLAEIIKKELFKPWIKRDKPIYKVWFQQAGKSRRYFLLDTYQKHRAMILDQLPVGSVNNFVLNQGQVYQFFAGFG